MAWGLGRRLATWVERAAQPLPGRRREFGIYWLATFLINGAWGLTMPLLSVYLYESGMSLAAVGLVQALAGLSAFVSQAVVGTLSDRRASRRTYLILSTAATVPVFLAIPHLQGVVLALAVMINGLLMATYVTMLYASVTALGRPGAAGRTFAFYRISGSVGWCITTSSLGWVLAWGGIPGAYRLGAGLFVVITLFLLVSLRAPVAAAPAPAAAHLPAGASEGTAEPGAPRIPAARMAPVLETVPDPRRILRHPELRLFYLAASLFVFAQTAGGVYFPIFLREGLQVSDRLFGILQAVPSMCEVPFMLFFGRAGDRWGTARPLLAGYLAGVVRWTVLPFLAAPASLVMIQALQAFSFSAGEILNVSHLSERIGVGARGTAVGLLSSFQALGKVTAPVLAGIIGDAAGLRTVFFLAAGAMGLATGFMDASRRLEARSGGAWAMPGPERPGYGDEA